MAIAPISERDGYIWINGEFIEWKKTQIHILTHSLHYGGAVFEGIRSYNGKIFKLKDHMDRLFRSAAMLKYSPNFSVEEISRAAEKLLILNNLKDAYIRPLLWKGSESMRIHSPMLSINAMVSAWDVGAVEYRKTELNLLISSFEKPSSKVIPANCKSSANYQMASVAQLEALEEGYDDALMLDQMGFLAEATTSNIFFVKDGKIFTPIPDSALIGITRTTVMDIAKTIGIDTEEIRITKDDLESFTECFVTGTAIEVKAVNSITSSDKKKVSYTNNDITPKIISAYKNLVIS